MRVQRCFASSSRASSWTNSGLWTKPRRLPSVLLAGLWVLLLCQFPAITREASGKSNRGLAVSSEAPAAAREAMAVLEDAKQPGNAVDAAIVAALVGGMASPSSSGIGGGGFVNVWDAKARRSIILDFREVAPRTLDAPAFEARPFPAAERGRAVGVPGEIMGLYELHRRYGRRDWASLVGRAAHVAERGFSVTKFLARAVDANRESLALDAQLSATWLPAGKPRGEGAWVTNERLARTLRAIAEQGPKAFYEGPVAAEIVSTAAALGGSLTLDDLREYRVKERSPLEFAWKGYTVHTMPLPSAGGYILAHTLNVYSTEDLTRLGAGSPAYAHALGESFRAALSDRMTYFGDPDLENVDLSQLLDKGRLQERRRGLSLERTHGLPRFNVRDQGTHHLVVRDAEGNVVSLTTTVNSAFGADVVTKESGIVLNDQLDDFTSNGDVARFGLTESPNRPRPGARPMSSMTPTIVTENGEAVLAVGGSGGMNIATDVTQALLLALLFDKTPLEAVSAPRIQVPLSRATLRVKQTLGADFVADLERRGEVVRTYERTSTAVQMVKVRGGAVSAAADPQKRGLALVR